ncbi:MAG: hydrogenase maturation protease [Deltaproteobacteria bacterium]|nr:hydrogenase maturation protease [Deltaproteobacteria bacterium]
MRTLVLGLGNPILSDDGVGLAVARELRGRVDGVDVRTTPMVGLEILDWIGSYGRVFLVDALTTRGGRVGAVRRLTPDDGTLHLFSSHGVNFFELLELGRRLGHPVPEVGGIYGIEIGDEVAFGVGLSPAVEAAIPAAVEAIAGDLRT